ncbi:hypothetical protein ACFL0W_03735 [Nanoarchaeota archaeon]
MRRIKMIIGVVLVLAILILSGCDQNYTGYQPINDSDNESSDSEGITIEKDSDAKESDTTKRTRRTKETDTEEETDTEKEETKEEETDSTESTATRKIVAIDPVVDNEENPDDTEETTDSETTETASETETTETETTTTTTTSSDGTPTIKVKEGEIVKIGTKGTDADGDKLEYTFTAPIGANGEWQTDSEDAGEYEITVTATDGQSKVTKKVLVIVEEVNRAPVIESIAPITIKEGETATLSPVTSDPDGDELTITYGTPFDNEGKWEIGYESEGEKEVKVTVSDGKETASTTVKITVENVNRAPDFEIVI